jgi:excisionase family DNA binding protein
MLNQTRSSETLLTVKQAASRLQVSKWTVYRRVADGQLPAVKLGEAPRSPIRIIEREFDLWLYANPQDTP